MGKKKIEINPIADKTKRSVSFIFNLWLLNQICFVKRKRGLLKKAMELSILTGNKVMLAIFDEADNKLSLYKSFEIDSVLANATIAKLEHFSDGDVSFVLHFLGLRVYGRVVQQPLWCPGWGQGEEPDHNAGEAITA